MSKPPPSPPSLAELRQEIDSIDSQVHSLLMQRGDIIDRLIRVKKTQEVGSAFRPAREADMMRRLVQRHRGILPLDTVESIWRVIISTFTYVQAPFSVHADVSVGKSMMRDSARFHFGFTVPYVSHFNAPAAVEAVAKSKGDLALLSATSSRTPWWIALEAHGAPKIIARLPFVERADHPAALPVFVVSRVADSAMVTEVEMWSVRVSGWNAETARALSPMAEILAVPDTAFDGAALLVSVTGETSLENIKAALIEAGASVRSSALVGSHATRYTVPNGSGLSSRPVYPELKMSRPVPNPGILDIAPYTPGKSPRAEAGRKVFKLSANETPFGPSPKAIEAYKNAAAHLKITRKARRVSCAKRSGARSGSIPTASSVAQDPMKSSTCSRTPISARAMRRFHDPRLSGLSDRDDGKRRRQRGRARDRLHRQCRCDPQARHAADQTRLARQPE